MIDTHCHLDRPEFDADRDAVLARAAAAGVTDVIVPAIGPDRWAALLALCAPPHPAPLPRGRGGEGNDQRGLRPPVEKREDQRGRHPPSVEGRAGLPGGFPPSPASAGEGVRGRGPRLHAALGLHPQLLPELDPRDDDRHLADLEAALSRGGCVAVGECGLDGAAAAAGAPLDRQLRVLEGQLALAARFGLPVLLHGLRALDPLRDLLDRTGLGPGGGVLHSYSGSAEQVGPFVRLGLHLALAGPVTYDRARKPLEAARAIPPDRLLLETDAPDQCPRPHRGRNEPAYVALVRDGVARALGVAPAEVEALTTANARRLFRLPA